MSTPYTLTNTHNLDILGDTHTPTSKPTACVVIAHGFKGYKDYGFIPILAHDLCEQGLLVHRFNFSTSGMTNAIETFARPDLFELDTWNRQVEDLVRVIEAIDSGELPGGDLPIFVIGHSRGGGTVLLGGGRHRDSLKLSGIITLSAVDRCCRIPQEEQDAILARGYSMTQSARTKQDLKISCDWLLEQLDDPAGHDILALAAKIPCPVCVIHGQEDQAVDPSAAQAIAKACATEPVIIAGGNHVLNMPNPSGVDDERSAQFVEALDAITRFIDQSS